METLENLIDQLIRSDLYKADYDEVKKLRIKAIKAAHKYHFENNMFYKRHCKAIGIGKEIYEKDLYQVLVPSEVFKSYPMDFPEENVSEFIEWLRGISTIKIPNIYGSFKSLDNMLYEFDKKGVLLGFSSGTSGRMTFLPRGKKTQEYLVRSYISTVTANVKLEMGKEYFVLGIPKKSYLQIAWNGRNVAETISPGNVFYAFDELKADIVRIRTGMTKNFKEKLISSLAGFMLPRVERKAEERILNKLLELKGRRIIFLAPPWILANIAKRILDKGVEVRLHEDSIISSTGGFKGRKVIDRKELNKLLEEALGINSDRYTDLYGMTESNSIFMECFANHVKHIPPWIEPILLDDQLEPIEPHGKTTGRFGFIEPSALSYPGFILTGDKVTIDWDGCDADDLNGPVILSIERIKGLEERGCAGALSRTFEG